MITTFPYSALRAFCKAIYGDVPLLLTPTVYTLDFGDFTASQTKTTTAQINANADFVLTGAACQDIDSDNLNGDFFLQDSSTSQALMSAPMPLNLWCSHINNNQGGKSLYYPYWISQNSAFLGQYVDTGSIPTGLMVSLIGFSVREYR